MITGNLGSYEFDDVEATRRLKEVSSDDNVIERGAMNWTALARDVQTVDRHGRESGKFNADQVIFDSTQYVCGCTCNDTTGHHVTGLSLNRETLDRAVRIALLNQCVLCSR